MARPKGQPKLGGRQKGSKNQATLARAQVIADALVAEALIPDQVAEMTPLTVLLRITFGLLRIIRAADQAGDTVAAQGPPVWRRPTATAD